MMDQVKYLRVILDKKLDYKVHLKNRMRKACIAYWELRRAVGKTWGLCTSVVRPILSYALNTNICFRGYVNVAALTFVHNTRGQTG
jgi:hypothetical protein